MGMPPQTFDVNGNVPVAVSAAPLAEALTVLNMAIDAVIYLSAEPGNRGFPLSPGSTMTWDAGQSLYVTTDDGKAARIGVVFNGGQIIDSRALAQQIVAAGLADEIATKISVAGVPVIDRAKNIVNASGTFTGSTGLTDGFIDVTGYSSITGVINSASLSIALCELIVEQADDPAGVGFTQTRYTFVEGVTRFDIPITGNYLAMTFQRTTGTSFTYDARFNVSYRNRRECISSLPNPWSAMSSTQGNTETSGIAWADLDIPADTRMVYYPAWTNGPFRLTWGFSTPAYATANTVGIGVVYGAGPNPGYNTERGRGSVGTALDTSTTISTLRTYEGFNSRLYPTLVVSNRNTTAQRINVTIQSPV